MGSAALAAAVPDPGTVTWISCKGQRSTPQKIKNKTKLTFVWHLKFWKTWKTRLQQIKIILLTLLKQSWLDCMLYWRSDDITDSCQCHYHSVIIQAPHAVLPLKLIGLSQQRVEGFANPLPVGRNGGHSEGSNILHTHTQRDKHKHTYTHTHTHTHTDHRLCLK